MDEETSIQETAAVDVDDGWGDEGVDLSDVADDEADAPEVAEGETTPPPPGGTPPRERSEETGRVGDDGNRLADGGQRTGDGGRVTPEDTRQQAAEKRDADIRSFVSTYPGVDPKSIPQEVWGAVAKGATLTEAYTRYENRQLRLQLEAEKKNRENEQRAAGSRGTDGQKDKEDIFDKYWNEDE